MISVAEAISDLLFVRDTVVVPGLGAFVKKSIPAKVNPVANYFSMPSSEISFDPNLREDNDLVVRYLSEKNGMPEEEAKKLLAMFVSDCFNTLKDKKKLVLNGIGTLSYDADDLVFKQDTSVNYNSDVFGLADFTPQPVLRSKTKAEIKSEIEQQQKDKNTPVTVDEKAVHEEDDHVKHRPRWIWAAAIVVLFGSALFVYLKPDFFKSTHQNHLETANVGTGSQIVVSDNDTLTAVGFVENVVDEEANIRVVAGCYDQEEPAERMVNLLISKGFVNAFKEKRGERWFVSFGRYATDEEATAALREIRTNTEYKAWILK